MSTNVVSQLKRVLGSTILLVALALTACVPGQPTPIIVTATSTATPTATATPKPTLTPTPTATPTATPRPTATPKVVLRVGVILDISYDMLNEFDTSNQQVQGWYVYRQLLRQWQEACSSVRTVLVVADQATFETLRESLNLKGVVALGSVDLEEDFPVVIRLIMKVTKVQGPYYKSPKSWWITPSWGLRITGAIELAATASDLQPVRIDGIVTNPYFPPEIRSSIGQAFYNAGGGAEDFVKAVQDKGFDQAMEQVLQAAGGCK